LRASRALSRKSIWSSSFQQLAFRSESQNENDLAQLVPAITTVGAAQYHQPTIYPMQSSTKSNLVPIIILGALFFVFGFVTWLNGTLIPYLKIACELSTFQALRILHLLLRYGLALFLDFEKNGA
jgi:hypothetical protein